AAPHARGDRWRRRRLRRADRRADRDKLPGPRERRLVRHDANHDPGVPGDQPDRKQPAAQQPPARACDELLHRPVWGFPVPELTELEPSPPVVSLRPAAEADRAFLKHLYRSVRWDELAPT